ncbi:MAG: hypothetical protein RSB47_08860, partial [Ruthenibacterium sp.]
HQPNFNWQEIETVLLDMDGTLLDLEFDSYFWLNLVPQTLSERRGITLDEVKAELASRHVIDHKVKQETMR